MELVILQTTDDVIEALGGNRAVGDLTTSNAKAVSNWRGSKFPAWTYLAIKGALKRTGKSAPDALWAMNPPASKKRQTDEASA